MKLSLAIFAVFLVVLFCGSEAAPAENFPQISTLEAFFEPAIVDHGVRYRRDTGDHLKFGTKWGFTPYYGCAAHCLAVLKGYKDGQYDSKGVCVCKK